MSQGGQGSREFSSLLFTPRTGVFLHLERVIGWQCEQMIRIFCVARQQHRKQSSVAFIDAAQYSSSRVLHELNLKTQNLRTGDKQGLPDYRSPRPARSPSTQGDMADQRAMQRGPHLGVAASRPQAVIRKFCRRRRPRRACWTLLQVMTCTLFSNLAMEVNEALS